MDVDETEASNSDQLGLARYNFLYSCVGEAGEDSEGAVAANSR